MWKILLLLLTLVISSFAFQQELSKDDNSFESSLATTSDVGIGQIYSMPDSYSLLSAKIYLQSHTTLLTVYVYSNDGVITTLGIATKSNPVNGWNLVSLSNIQLPSVLPMHIIAVVRDSGSVGEDWTPPDYQHYRVQYYPIYNLFNVDPNNVGVRLIINNIQPGVQATSLGNIKASFR
jgi:hypothetical protein